MDNKLPKTFSGKMLYDKLQIWRETRSITLDDMCKTLGWHSQQLYAMNDEQRTVRASTIAHILEKLEIDPDWLLSDDKDYAYVQIFKKYPHKVLVWLASEKGKEEMMKAYGLHAMREAQSELAQAANVVYNAN